MVTCDLMILKHINDIFMTYYTVETLYNYVIPLPQVNFAGENPLGWAEDEPWKWKVTTAV